jgi:hypothetical protein
MTFPRAYSTILTRRTITIRARRMRRVSRKSKRKKNRVPHFIANDLFCDWTDEQMEAAMKARGLLEESDNGD